MAHRKRDDAQDFGHRSVGGADLFLIQESKDFIQRHAANGVARACDLLGLVEDRAEMGVDAVDAVRGYRDGILAALFVQQIPRAKRGPPQLRTPILADSCGRFRMIFVISRL
jgi:hypothetical protein